MKNSTSQESPLVRIEYNPANALPVLASSVTKAIAGLNAFIPSATAKPIKITDVRTLNKADYAIELGQVAQEELDEFCATLRARVQEAAERFRQYEGFHDFEVTLTIRQWGLKSLLADRTKAVRNARAQFLADEQEKTRRAQLEAEAEQARINKKAADKAAAEAKAQGASKETVAEIREAVKSTPAPEVQSKVLDSATSTIRYQYDAKITNLKSFLGAALNNDALFNTLCKAIPDIEKAFNRMAQDQKEAFNFPGMTFDKKAVDVKRRSA